MTQCLKIPKKVSFYNNSKILHLFSIHSYIWKWNEIFSRNFQTVWPGLLTKKRHVGKGKKSSFSSQGTPDGTSCTKLAPLYCEQSTSWIKDPSRSRGALFCMMPSNQNLKSLESWKVVVLQSQQISNYHEAFSMASMRITCTHGCTAVLFWKRPGRQGLLGAAVGVGNWTKFQEYFLSTFPWGEFTK